MRRGEVWTVLADGYASKPRPVIIIQSDDVTEFQSVITCLLTTYESTNIATRVRIEPSSGNGLNRTSWAMTDKIVTVSRSTLGEKVGVLEQDTMNEISRQISIVLGL